MCFFGAGRAGVRKKNSIYVYYEKIYYIKIFIELLTRLPYARHFDRFLILLLYFYFFLIFRLICRLCFAHQVSKFGDSSRIHNIDNIYERKFLRQSSSFEAENP